jgi:hypothetical protein
MSEIMAFRGARPGVRRQRRKKDLLGALSLMEEALDLLDEEKVRSDVGAHLDLAIHHLRNVIDQQQG